MNGLLRIYRALGYSLAGLRACWRQEASFRLEVAAGIPLIGLAFLWGRTRAEVCILIGALLAVLMCELLNSAIEKVADLACSGQQHPLVKYAKDTASAAVLISMIIAILVWVAVLV